MQGKSREMGGHPISAHSKTRKARYFQRAFLSYQHGGGRLSPASPHALCAHICTNCSYLSRYGGETMSKVLGIHLFKGEMRYAVLAGTKKAPELVFKDKLLTTDPSDIPELMDWYDSQFKQILNQHAPDKISHRLTLEPNKEQLFYSIFPLGILNLLAHANSIPINSYTHQAYRANRLNLPRDTDLYSHCDTVFGECRPHWDKNMKNAILAAWFDL